MLKFRGKGQIPRLGSKLCSPQKTVGPNNNPLCLTVINHLLGTMKLLRRDHWIWKCGLRKCSINFGSQRMDVEVL